MRLPSLRRDIWHGQIHARRWGIWVSVGCTSSVSMSRIGFTATTTTSISYFIIGWTIPVARCAVSWRAARWKTTSCIMRLHVSIGTSQSMTQHHAQSFPCNWILVKDLRHAYDQILCPSAGNLLQCALKGSSFGPPSRRICLSRTWPKTPKIRLLPKHRRCAKWQWQAIKIKSKSSSKSYH